MHSIDTSQDTQRKHKVVRHVDPAHYHEAKSYGEKPFILREHSTRAVDMNYGYVPMPSKGECLTQADKENDYHLQETADANRRRFGL